MENKVRTLIADDHDLIRAGLRGALSSIPELEIIGEASNGNDLFEAVENTALDLLVMDVNMPNFEPVSAVKRILITQPELKILVVSAYDDQAYVTGLFGAGVKGYHLKDQPISELQLAVRRVLENKRWLSDPLVNLLVQHQTAPEPAIVNLSKRQRELLYLLTQGCNNQTIAILMGISVKTVENHLTSLYRLIGVESRLEANNFASLHSDLPLSPEKVATNPTGTSSRSSQDETVKILLVDDNYRYRAQLEKMIKRSYPSVIVFEADDAADAYQIAQQSKPDLAIIDVVMNDEDGIQCTKKLKKIAPMTRIILISAYPDRELHRLGMDAGACAFLDKKDIDTSAVRQVIGDALAN